MPQISVSVTETGAILHYEPSDDMTLATLKEFIAAETGVRASALTIFRDGAKMRNDEQSLGALGVQNHDVLFVHMSSSAQPRQPDPSTMTNPFPRTNLDRQADTSREQILADTRLTNQLRNEAPQLADALHDPALFREKFSEHMLKMQIMQKEQIDSLAALDNEVTAENQEKIAEHIRQTNVEQQYTDVITEYPEFFAKVTMLYIDVQVNGHPVKAFVDSGAQATIMSPSCADACGVTRLIDKRFAGLAHGVGTAVILGRVHRANMIVGDVELPCSFTVMEGKDVDLLFGLDMLKRYQSCIDLENNVLRFKGGVSVPFLPESEIPRAFEEARANEPTVNGPDGAQIGAETGAVKSNPSAIGSGAAATSASASASASTTGGPSSGLSNGVGPSSASQSTTRRPQPAASMSGALPFPQKDIDILVEMGATQEQAIEALKMCDGNVDVAAGHVLGF